ncbi:MAG: hypothetical protein AB1898_30535 [Acidobacteriota bacterium]
MNWTPFRLQQAGEIQQIVDELEPYHPLTLRKVHYQAVSSGVREKLRRYQAVA